MRAVQCQTLELYLPAVLFVSVGILQNELIFVVSIEYKCSLTKSTMVHCTCDPWNPLTIKAWFFTTLMQNWLKMFRKKTQELR